MYSLPYRPWDSLVPKKHGETKVAWAKKSFFFLARSFWRVPPNSGTDAILLIPQPKHRLKHASGAQPMLRFSPPLLSTPDTYVVARFQHANKHIRRYHEPTNDFTFQLNETNPVSKRHARACAYPHRQRLSPRDDDQGEVVEPEESADIDRVQEVEVTVPGRRGVHAVRHDSHLGAPARPR